MRALTLALLVITVLINSGCSSKLAGFEKRKYTKGYHIDVASRTKKQLKSDPADAKSISVKNNTAPETNPHSVIPHSITDNMATGALPLAEKEKTASLTSAEQPATKKQFRLTIPSRIKNKFAPVFAKKNFIKNSFSDNTASSKQTQSYFIFYAILMAALGLATLIYIAMNPSSPLLLVVAIALIVGAGVLVALGLIYEW